MPNNTRDRRQPIAEVAHIANEDSGEKKKSFLQILLEIKEWIGLSVAVAAAIISSGGWLLTYFAKKEEVDVISCKTEAKIRMLTDDFSIQIINQRKKLLTKSINEKLKNRDPSSEQLVFLKDDEESDSESIDALKAARKTAKENLKTLSNDRSLINNSLIAGGCNSKDGRDELKKILQSQPLIKEEE